MKIIRSHQVVLKDESLMTRINGVRYCIDHEQHFSECRCPKQTSTPENDGWLLDMEGDKIVAYPTESLYHEFMLWVQKDGGSYKCLGCGKSTRDMRNMTEVECQDITEAFFDEHWNCGRGK